MCTSINDTDLFLKRMSDLEAANQALKMQLKSAKKEIFDLKKGKTTTNVKHVRSKGGYEKFKKLTIDEVLPHIGAGGKLLVGIIEGVKIYVNTSSVRLQTFKKNLVCVGCGIQGLYFWAECNPGCFNYHLNLYGVNEAGDEVLMTRDHIIPRSKNGADTIGNMQTMCHKCNNKKGNKIL